MKIYGTDRRRLLGIIQRDMDYIHKSLNNPENSEMIPCKCKECEDSSDIFYFDFYKLKKALNSGKLKAQCQNSFESINIEDLLGHFKNTEEISSNIHIHHHNHEGANMKISKLEIKNSQVNFADEIGKINYNPKLSIAEEEFQTIKKHLLNLSSEEVEKLSQMLADIAGSPSPPKKLFESLSKIGINITQGISASALYETLKYILVI